MTGVGRLIVVSAHSGAGKSSLVEALLAELRCQYSIDRAVTYTTRAPRVSDVPGQDYHFVSRDVFLKKVEEGFFLEWSCAYDNYYGSPAYLLNELAQGNSRILIMDIEGVRRLLALGLTHAVYIWISVSDVKTLQQRLHDRRTETGDQQAARLSLVAQEQKRFQEVQHLFHHVICNDDFNFALKNFKRIVSCALQSLKKY